MKEITDPKVLQGLETCYKTAYILKEQFPNEIMAIKKDTILPHQAKNRKCHGKNMSGYAWYWKKRVTIQQKCLAGRPMLITKIKNQKDRHMLYGNFALIELMCHELAHHRTTGHAKSFKKKYHRFLDYMVNQIISGKYYTP